MKFRRAISAHGYLSRAIFWSSLGLLLAFSTACVRNQEKRYPLTGTIISVDKEQARLTVDHKEIPGFMAAMAMAYPVADAKALDEVGPGDEIKADVLVGKNGVRLANIAVVKKSDGKLPSSASPNLADEGPVPGFTLINQNGKPITLDQFRGKSVLLTFIYTRCPLPDYCPLMSHNFAQIEQQLASSPSMYGRTHLLSISFDSKYDTPPVLRNYAKAFVKDRGARTFEHWEFATIPAEENSAVAKFFNLFVTEEQGQITHSMSTAIISPDGRIYKMHSGNDWKPEDVLRELTASVGTATTENRSPALDR